MRVQHNIMAMNSYRNYNNNTKALSGNLEKLSSGYKINRAGDDAAGLAISEKMRAQITGLEAAQKNVKDGISLVKTAEGAMQEIQDMLNRMDYLATQSANGTYQNEVDRENLNKEVTALKTEINRIADSANFNGIKLLDGSLSGGGAGGAADIQNLNLTPATQAASTEKGKATYTSLDATAAVGDILTFEFGFVDKNGNEVTKSVDLTVSAVSTGGTMTLKDADGNTYSGKNTAATISSIAASAANNAGIFKGMGLTFDGSAAAATVTAAASGASAHLKTAAVLVNGQATKGGVAVTRTTIGKDAMDVYNLSGAASTAIYAGKSTQDINDFIFTVDGKKFALAKDGQSKNFASDVNVITVAGSTKATTLEVQNIVATINRVVGKDVAAVNTTVGGTVNKLKIEFKQPVKGDTSVSGGLRLQIGDTADSFNQMMVQVGDMHTSALGIDGVDISNQDGAAAAISVIKNAINTVSSVRGDLGAIQNRLDHTGNNLSVMAENIQDAESTIRDTDVAEEMMSYVKNNILVQSAQAMLAQANQVPQGVLQLLG